MYGDFLIPKDLRIKQDIFFGRSIIEMAIVLFVPIGLGGIGMLFGQLLGIGIGCISLLLAILFTTTLAKKETVFHASKRINRFRKSTKFYQQAPLEMAIVLKFDEEEKE
ncbi:MAG: hypothetical protein ACRC17_03115 [Culicoidibacterales bacterium]